MGEVAEWLKAAVSKTVVRLQRTQGSNPCLSAYFFLTNLPLESQNVIDILFSAFNFF